MVDEWQQVDAIPGLGADEVQVWRFDLAQWARPELEWLRMLSSEEAERAGRLRAGQVRMQFLVGRSCLRQLLGRELEIATDAVGIVTGTYGKPQTSPAHGIPLHFNVAHSRSTVLIALSRTGPVGVDVEYLDRKTDVMEVARHALTAAEMDALRAIADGDARRSAFFECWTRKEAVVKADGRGLSLALSSFEIPVGATCHMLPIAVGGNERFVGTRYFVSDLPGGTRDEGGTASAVAVAVQTSRMRCLVGAPAVFDPFLGTSKRSRC